MARSIVVDAWISEVLRRTAEAHQVSAKGVLESLVLALDGNDKYGVVELDWGKVKKQYPSREIYLAKRWDQIVDVVVEMFTQGVDDVNEICRRTRLTEAQVRKAMPDALVKMQQRRRKK